MEVESGAQAERKQQAADAAQLAMSLRGDETSVVHHFGRGDGSPIKWDTTESALAAVIPGLCWRCGRVGVVQDR